MDIQGKQQFLWFSPEFTPFRPKLSPFRLKLNFFPTQENIFRSNKQDFPPFLVSGILTYFIKRDSDGRNKVFSILPQGFLERENTVHFLRAIFVCFEGNFFLCSGEDFRA